MTHTDSSSTKSNSPQQRESAKIFAIAAARSLTDSQCTDTVVLDLKGKSPVADFLVITTGTSDRQMKSSADDVIELAPNTDHALVRQAADNRNTWIVSDFGDVVVHVFEPDTRAFYDLELLWGDASRVAWQRD
jgi:ribosome-associated protein